jgi:hypothetical protein
MWPALTPTTPRCPRTRTAADEEGLDHPTQAFEPDHPIGLDRLDHPANLIGVGGHHQRGRTRRSILRRDYFAEAIDVDPVHVRP